MCLAYVCSVKGKRQTGEKRDGERARHVAAPSGRLLFLSSCCLRAGGSTAAPCQLLLPQKPPCMQNRLRLPSLLGHAFPSRVFLSPYNSETSLFSFPPLSEAGCLFKSISSHQTYCVLSNSYNTYKYNTWHKSDSFTGRNISRADTDKEKMYCCYFSDQIYCVLLDSSIPPLRENKWTYSHLVDLFHQLTSSFTLNVQKIKTIFNCFSFSFIAFHWQ